MSLGSGGKASTNLPTLLEAAQAHHARCVTRYGEGSYQARMAEQAVATIKAGR